MLMQSLRALGYTVEAAVADLLDNSIAASASTVEVSFSVHPEPHVAIIDDGFGMDEGTLVEAMRFGSADPRDRRLSTDLGRFGLGLKTASLSQCRRVTVISLHGGALSAAEWDLDECERRGTWWLRRPDPLAECPDLARLLVDQGRGTAVLWRKLDRLLPVESRDLDTTLDAALAGLTHHLGFTFHRFVSGTEGIRLAICVNGRPVPRIDPFLEGHRRGQVLHQETFDVEGVPVTVTPFILPFPSRLSPAELELAGGRDRIKTGHGFYVYRGKRLVVPGGWFRIVPADDLVRLARVRVDVPVELDHIWRIDIRKTVVEPPRALRPHLKRIVGDAARRSRKVYEFRGAADPRRQGEQLWVRRVLRDGAVAWSVDRQHPAIAALATGRPDDTDRLLHLIEEALPVHDIHVHVANDVRLAEPDDPNEGELEDLARRLFEAMRDDTEARARLASRLPGIEPFNRNPELAKRIAERMYS
jgi:hypothetical protein